MDKLDELINWYLNSPIYKDGQYLAFYSRRNRGPIYPEITAYSISLSCILHARRGDPQFLKRAERAAAFMEKIRVNGGVPSFSDSLSYVFDTGIFVSGVLDLYALTNKEQYLRAAEESLQWILRLWEEKPYSSTSEIPEEPAWHHLPGVHLAKLAIPFIKASKYSGNKEYEDVATEILGKFKNLQTPEGAFRISDVSNIIVTHPHCYSTEGFLYAYHKLQNLEYLEIAKKASNWLSNVQNSDGSLYQSYTTTKMKLREERIKTSDATAQATRVWKLLGVFPERIEKSYNFLDSMLSNGGLLLKKNSLANMLSNWNSRIYSWPTFFYIHSLVLPFGKMEFCTEIF